MMAKMREIEPTIRATLLSILRLPDPSLKSVLEWLEGMARLWQDHAIEFSAIEQAMAEDAAVAREWLGMLRRLSDSAPELVDDTPRRFQYLAALMAMDRSFYFLHVRGHDMNKTEVHRALARQWLLVLEN